MPRPFERTSTSNNWTLRLSSPRLSLDLKLLVLIASLATAVSGQRLLSHQVQKPSTIASLEIGKTIERELALKDTDAYTLQLETNQYVRIQADQRRIDVTLSIFDPSGKELVQTDLFRTGEPESIFVVAQNAGNYRLE